MIRPHRAAGDSKWPVLSAVVVAVAHEQFKALAEAQWKQLIVPDGVLVDLKGLLSRELQAIRL